MLFSSPTFLFIFLPLVLGLYFLLGKKLQNPVLIVTSLVFYFWGEPEFIYILVTLIVLNYFLGRVISKNHKKRSKIFLFLAIAINLLVLIIYKYRLLFLEGLIFINDLFKFSLRYQSVSINTSLVPPLAISFFTFHAISYQIDVYKGKSKAEKNFLKLAVYFLMFPHLLAGPILRFHQIKEKLDSRSISIQSFSEGVTRFAIGLAKKVIIADRLALAANEIFAIKPSHIDTPTAWLGLIVFTFQIYFDFSAYSDMAIGLAKMLGFDFPENFNYPYISQSIREFWRRWHITLSNWFRDYVYIPLGGDRVSANKTYLNLMIVFLLCGLWHGAHINFVIWGGIHGTFLVLERVRNGLLFNWMPRVLKHIYAFSVVMLSWVFFRIDNFGDIIIFLRTLLGMADNAVKYRSAQYFLMKDLVTVLIFAIIFAFPIYPFLAKIADQSMQKYTKQKNIFIFTFGGIKVIYLILLLFMSYIMISSQTYKSFIYFKF